MKLYYYSCAAIIIAAIAAIPVASGQFTCTFSGASDESSCIHMEDEANQHCVWCALDGNNHHSSNNNNNNINNNKKTKTMKMNQEIFEMKKLIQTLEAARGDGMSMISLIVPPGDRFSRVNKMLSDEYAVASNINSRVMNRPKILSALSCTQQRLKRYSNCPPNGLVVYCGTVVTEDGTEQNVSIDFEPFLPINTSLYLIDNTFHTEDLSELLLLDDHNIETTTTTTDFGFCVSEVQAETIEQITPELVHCDRYSGTDDAVPTTDDTTPTPPTTDDTTPSNTDDATPPLPDNYWQCLKEKDEDSCTDKDCTWCDTPVGYGVCMTGPSAEAAETSKWFTCKTNSTTTTTTTTSSSSVDTTTTSTTLRALVKNPMDPSCALVYLQDPSQEACEAAVDADGTPCEFCSFQDALQLCLNIDQAEMGEQFGLECGTNNNHNNNDHDASTTRAGLFVQPGQEDPLDPSCALVYLQDPSKEACEAAVDVHGNSCLFCSLQDAFQLCLNVDQAAMGEQYGIECDDDEEEKEEDNVSIMAVKIQDPFDPSCALIFLQDPSPEACEAATDADGNPCEFCSLPGSLQVCLNAEQAEIGEQFGLECDDNNNIDHYYDDDDVPNQTFPDDLIECLEHYQENDCRQSDCTWCNTQVGMGFCVTLSIAETTKPFPFFDCEFGTTSSSTTIA